MSESEPEIAVAVENIPEELQNRDQWLLWDARADRPKQPHWNGNHRISWSSPDDWATFDDAVEAVESRDWWGLGYVTAAENDDYARGLYAVIDLDGAFDDDGHARDWVPDLSPFFDRDAYVEISPSGTGLHIPVVGMEVPEWWADVEVSADAHEGVDLLANKFCTFTGDLARGSGTEVVEYGEWIDEWLADAYEEIEGEAPPTRQSPTLADARGGEGGSGDTDDWNRETVEEMLDTLPNNQHYNDWRDTLFAIHNWDSGTTGKAVAEKWSRSNSKWEESESQRVIDDIWENRDPSGPVTLGTLVHKAQQAGWEPSGPADWKQAVAEHSEEYDDPSEVPDDIFANETESDETADIGVESESDADTDTDTASAAETDETADADRWEVVREVYDQDKPRGRQAARSVLSDRYHFAAVPETETLLVYDPDTGVYSDNHGDLNAEIYDGLGEHWSTHEVNEIKAGLRQTNRVETQDLDAGDRDAPLRCVENGVLNLLTRELHDHSPDYHFVTRLPVAYDPDADPTPYEEFVDEMTARRADRDAMLEMVGHALMPDANRRYKKFLILSGDGDNGKSEFYRRVKDLLNGPDGEESNTSSVKLAKLSQNRFSVYSMHGSMANIAGEIDGKKIRNTAALKDITGGDEVEIEPKGQDSFFDRLETTLMFAANDPPILGERDKQAIASRIVPVELPYEFVDPESEKWDADDPQMKERVPEHVLDDRLQTPEALSGFLNAALDGIDRLEANNGDVSLPESPRERLDDYERAADPMREFGEACLENAQQGEYIVKADVTAVYQEWARANGYEVGSSVDSVLHGVLRGVASINYSDSKPRSPDYTGTDLPLRGWDERKEVVDRVTFTDEGMKYAREAGLVEETTTDATGSEVPLSPSEVTVESANARGRLPAIEGTVVGVSPNKYKTPTVTLTGDNAALDIEIPTEDTHPELVEGEKVRIVGAKISTDDLGIVQGVIRPDTEVVALSSFASSDHDGGEAAAADGGTAATAADTADTPRPDSDAETAADDAESDARGSVGTGAPTNVETLTVVPTETLGEIMGVDGQDYEVVGGEPIELPLSNAETLITQGAATEVSDADSVESVRGRVLEWIRTHEPATVSAPGIAGKSEIDAPPETVADALAALSEERSLLQRDPEVGSSGATGYRVDT